MKSSLTTSSKTTASTITSSTSYAFKASIPTSYDPYIVHSDDKDGTIFIAVGTILIALFVFFIIAKFWFFLKNRKAAELATKYDDIYAGNYYDSSSSVLHYDSAFFDEKKSSYGTDSPSSGTRSTYSHSTNPSTSSRGSETREDVNNYTSQPGRNLRNAYRYQNYNPKRRESFISPINELINDSSEKNEDPQLATKRMSYIDLLDSTVNQTPDSNNNSTTHVAPPSRRKTQSISMLFNSPIDNDHTGKFPHAKSPSVDFGQVHKLVNQSLVSVNQSPSTPSTASEGSSAVTRKEKPGKKNRPPSMVLDMLVQNGMNTD